MKSSSIAQRLNLEQLMTSLRMLNQQSDVSKQQPFSPHFGDESHSLNSLQKENSGTLQKVQERESLQGTLVQICRKETFSQWSPGQEQHQISELKQMNKKLFEDNKVLIKECIRLRKTVKTNSKSQIEQQNQILNTAQIINFQNQNQINRLKIQNIQLKLALISVATSRNLSSQGNSSQVMDKQWSFLKANIQQVKQSTCKISAKIDQITEKDKFGKLSRSNTTTVTSRAQELERERIISNIKSAYQDKIRVLQIQIKEKKEEIERICKNQIESRNRFFKLPQKY